MKNILLIIIKKSVLIVFILYCNSYGAWSALLHQENISVLSINSIFCEGAAKEMVELYNLSTEEAFAALKIIIEESRQVDPCRPILMLIDGPTNIGKTYVFGNKVQSGKDKNFNIKNAKQDVVVVHDAVILTLLENEKRYLDTSKMKPSLNIQTLVAVETIDEMRSKSHRRTTLPEYLLRDYIPNLFERMKETAEEDRIVVIDMHNSHANYEHTIALRQYAQETTLVIKVKITGLNYRMRSIQLKTSYWRSGNDEDKQQYRLSV